MNRAALLWGSPKPESRAASLSLGRYLMDRLSERGFECEEFKATRVVADDEGTSELLGAVQRCDLLICSLPLYYDSLPGPMTRALEIIRDAEVPPAERRLVGISQCGFPETKHNQTAVRILRLFARECGFKWVGGLAMGMGGAVGGPPLERSGWRGRNARKALETAAEALASGASVPDEAVALFGKPLMPAWLYRTVGNVGWKRNARKHGVQADMMRTPYQDAS